MFLKVTLVPEVFTLLQVISNLWVSVLYAILFPCALEKKTAKTKWRKITVLVKPKSQLSDAVLE